MKKVAVFSLALAVCFAMVFMATPEAKACPGDPGFMYYDNLGQTYCVDTPNCPPCFGQIPRFCRPTL